MSAMRVFDYNHYEALNSSRGAVVSALLKELKRPLGLQTAIDVGCGLGYFSGLLQSLGLDVTGVDGRQENAKEASARWPSIKFHTMNAEDQQLPSFGTFDLVFCFGLLYHLENPLLAIRNLRAMTKSLLLVEGLVYPGEEPIMGLVDEMPYEDQGLQHYAFYPTEACLLKMIYRAGFPCVYRFVTPPDHPEYHDTPKLRKNRTILAASLTPIPSELLVAAPEPRGATNPARLPPDPLSEDAISKLRRFADKSMPQKMEAIKRLVKGK
jgi:SAM-dependent methyltransferase